MLQFHVGPALRADGSNGGAAGEWLQSSQIGIDRNQSLVTTARGFGGGSETKGVNSPPHAHEESSFDGNGTRDVTVWIYFLTAVGNPQWFGGLRLMGSEQACDGIFVWFKQMFLQMMLRFT